MNTRLLKIVLCLALIVSLSACVFGFIMCGKNNGGSSSASETDSAGSSETTITVTMKKETEQVEEYQTLTLFATVEGTDEKINWSSSDESVATVSADGVVYGVKRGKAKITAKVGNAEAVCEVTVTETYNMPVIGFSDYIAIEEGESYSGEVKVTFNKEDVTDISEINWYYGDGADESVLGISAGENGRITFNALKKDTIELFVSASVRGVYVNKTITVKVTERVINVVPDGNYVKAGENGYEIILSTAEKDGIKTEIPLTFTVYDGKTTIKNAEIAWDEESEYYDPATAVVEGANGKYTVKKVAAGKTRLDGTYTSANGREIDVRVFVTVEKTVKILPALPVIEVENLTEINIPAEIDEEVRAVTINGKNVLKSAANGKITLDKAKLPTSASELGLIDAVISTDNCDFIGSVEIYSLVISNKAEFDSMREIARANGNISATGKTDGYFVLDSDIDYNGEFISITDSDEIYNIKTKIGGPTWTDGGFYGFKGVFDGRGYNIDGLTVRCSDPSSSGGILGCMNNAGVFKNVSFTNAGLYENSGFICSFGGGTVENVSVSFKNVGVGNTTRDVTSPINEPRFMGVCFTFAAGTGAYMKNCVIDALNADIHYEYSESKGVPSVRLATRASAGNVENVVVLINHEKSAELIKVSGATVFGSSYADFSTSGELNDASGELDKEYWTVINGIPIIKSVASKINADEKVKFTDIPSAVYCGGSAKVAINTKYGEIIAKDLYEGVTFENGLISVAENAESGEIVLEAKSFINGTTASETISIRSNRKVTVTTQPEIMLEKSDDKIDLSFAREYLGSTATLYYGANVLGDGALSGGILAISAGVIPTGNVTLTAYSEKDGVVYSFDVKVESVTKIIRTADDLKFIRYTQAMLDNGDSITGYYVLGNDIDLGGAKIKDELAFDNETKPFFNDGYGFRGTFDGKKHTITNFTVGNGGFFGKIGNGAVIRQVNFTDVTYSSDYLTALLAHSIQSAKLEYINITAKSVMAMTEGTHARGFLSSRFFKNNTVGRVTIDAPGAEVESVFGFVVASNTFSAVKVNLASYNILGYLSDVGEWKTEANTVRKLTGVTVTTGK